MRTRIPVVACTASGARSSSLDGALGYHELAWSCGGETGKALVIAAPTRAWGSPGNFERRWGVFAPVYGLASRDERPRRRPRRRCASCSRQVASARRRVRRDAADARGVSRRAVRVLAVLAGESVVLERALSRSRRGSATASASPSPAAPPPRPGLIDYKAQYAWRRPGDRSARRRVLRRSPTAPPPSPSGRPRTACSTTPRFARSAKRSARAGASGRRSCATAPSRARTRAEAIALGGDAARVDTHVFAQWAMQQPARRAAGRTGRRCISIFPSASAWTRTRSGGGGGCS